MLTLVLRKKLSWIAVAIAVCLTPPAIGSVHVTYNVLQQFDTDGFSASWLQSAVGGLNGTTENGALLTGATSSRIGGSLEGNLDGNILSEASGSVTGQLKQLKNYLNDQLGTNYLTSTLFELRLGEQANGGQGALAFETNGSGTGQFTGGYLNYSLYVDGSAQSILDGMFFFKPQAESGSSALSPNRGTSSEFTLWGWNWMHDGKPVDLAAEPNWGDFLSGLKYTGDVVQRTPTGAAVGSGSPLGISLYIVDPDPPEVAAMHNPEPTSCVIWCVLVCGAVGLRRRSSR